MIQPSPVHSISTSPSITSCHCRGRRLHRLVALSLAGGGAAVVVLCMAAILQATSRYVSEPTQVRRGLTPTQQLHWEHMIAEAKDTLILAKWAIEDFERNSLLQTLWHHGAQPINLALMQVLAPMPVRKPDLGETVAPFTLADLTGKPYCLAEVLGKRPIVLELSSYS